METLHPNPQGHQPPLNRNIGGIPLSEHLPPVTEGLPFEIYPPILQNHLGFKHQVTDSLSRKGDERQISRVRRLLIISSFILESKSILKDLQEALLRGNLRRIFFLAPLVMRIEIKGCFRPARANDQILVMFVSRNLPRPRVGVRPICESFPGAFSEDPQGFCSSESP
jgi:hypothetical protein